MIALAYMAYLIYRGPRLWWSRSGTAGAYPAA